MRRTFSVRFASAPAPRRGRRGRWRDGGVKRMGMDLLLLGKRPLEICKVVETKENQVYKPILYRCNL